MPVKWALRLTFALALGACLGVGSRGYGSGAAPPATKPDALTGGDADDGRLAALGTSDLQPLLHWAIEHSDKDELSALARRARAHDASWLESSRAHVREALDALHDGPSDSERMWASLSAARNESDALAYRIGALMELQELVEEVDLANDLAKEAGIAGLVTLAAAGSAPGLRIAAFKVLSVAAANNAAFQAHWLQQDPTALQGLLQIVADELQENLDRDLDERSARPELMATALLAAARLFVTSPPEATGALHARISGLPSDKASCAAPAFRLLLTVAADGETICEASAMAKCARHTRLAAYRAIDMLADAVANWAAVKDHLATCGEVARMWTRACDSAHSAGDEVAVEKLADVVRHLFHGRTPDRTAAWTSAAPCLHSALRRWPGQAEVHHKASAALNQLQHSRDEL